MQALSQEVIQEKIANFFQFQIKEQVAIIELLNNNLSAWIEVKTALEKCILNLPVYNNTTNNTQLLITSFDEKIEQSLNNQELLSENLLLERVKKLISEQQLIEVENISLEHSLVLGEYFGFFLLSSSSYELVFNDLGMDNLNGIELLMAIEEEFNIEISDAKAETIRTVQELVNFISFKLNQT